MGTDAVFALIFGSLYDKIGIKALVISTVLSLFFPIFGFQHNGTLALFGVLYDISIPWAIVFSIVMQAISIPFFFMSARAGASKVA